MNEFSGYAVQRGCQLMHPELLRKLLRYDPDTGKLFWLVRTIDLYPGDKKVSEALVQNWNAAFAGKEAFTATNNQGYKVGRIFDRGYLAHQIMAIRLSRLEPQSNRPALKSHSKVDRLTP